MIQEMYHLLLVVVVVDVVDNTHVEHDNIYSYLLLFDTSCCHLYHFRLIFGAWR